MRDNLAILIAGLAFVLSIGRTLFGGGYGLGKKLESLRSELLTAITQSRDEIESKTDKLSSDMGEGLRALREHVNLVEQGRLKDQMATNDRIAKIETWARDEFVKRTSFEKVVNDVRESVRDSADRVERGLDQMRKVFMEHVARNGKPN